MADVGGVHPEHRLAKDVVDFQSNRQFHGTHGSPIPLGWLGSTVVSSLRACDKSSIAADRCRVICEEGNPSNHSRAC